MSTVLTPSLEEMRGPMVDPQLLSLRTNTSYGANEKCTVDREVFAHKNIYLLNFRIVLFSSLWHTGSVASFLLFDAENFVFLIFVVIGYRQKFINDEIFPIYGA